MLDHSLDATGQTTEKQIWILMLILHTHQGSMLAGCILPACYWGLQLTTNGGVKWDGCGLWQWCQKWQCHCSKNVEEVSRLWLICNNNTPSSNMMMHCRSCFKHCSFLSIPMSKRNPEFPWWSGREWGGFSHERKTHPWEQAQIWIQVLFVFNMINDNESICQRMNSC